MTGANGSVRVVELDVNYKVIDLYWVYFRMMSRRVLSAFVLVPPAVVLAQGFSTNDFSFAPYLARSPWPQVWLLMLVYFLFGHPYLISKSLLRKDPFRFGGGHYRIDEESIVVERTHSRSTILWPSVQKATENPAVVILSLGAYTPIILPKRSFAGPAQLTTLRSLIQDHVQGKIRLRR
jgi:hypothetical protein